MWTPPFKGFTSFINPAQAVETGHAELQKANPLIPVTFRIIIKKAN